MTVNQTLINLLAIIGLFSSASFMLYLAKSCIHYMKYKEFPKTIEQEKMDILMEEKERLSKILEKVQQENDEMTRAVLQRIT